MEILQDFLREKNISRIDFHSNVPICVVTWDPIVTLLEPLGPSNENLVTQGNPYTSGICNK